MRTRHVFTPAGTSGALSADTLREGDVLAAALYHGTQGHPPMTPEKKLLGAVLEDAVHVLRRDLRSRHATAQRGVADILAWIAADEPGWPFSFVVICDVLGFDIGYVRAQVAALRQRATLHVVRQTHAHRDAGAGYARPTPGLGPQGCGKAKWGRW